MEDQDDSPEDPGRFEFFVKMKSDNVVSTDPGTLPVKFKAVFFDPSRVDVHTFVQDDVEDAVNDGDARDAGANLVGGFLRNPFYQSGFYPPEENEIGDAEKLGRNMRARSRGSSSQMMNVHEQMMAGKQLLQRQKDQLETVEKDLITESRASVLVNELLTDGFFIKPPQGIINEHHPGHFQADTSAFVDEEQVDRKQMIRAVYSELKKVGVSSVES